ncbi:hypothetical protein WDW89_02040, partial [Deltaproteobacteria bacterium TL4]
LPPPVTRAAPVPPPPQKASSNATIASVTTEGNPPVLNKSTLTERLKTILTQRYTLISYDEAQRIQDAAFEEIALRGCADESCINEIQKSFNVAKVYSIKLIGNLQSTNITVTMVGLNNTFEEKTNCSNCNPDSLSQKITELVSRLANR